MTDNNQLVSFVVLAYNQERFIAVAVRGALSQTYAPLEIILSDDCSPDQTFAIIQQEVAKYHGNHKVVVNRNAHNLGLGAHINRAMELASGQFIVLAGGDDISLPERVAELYAVYARSPETVFAVFSNAILIDEAGNQEMVCITAPDPQEWSLSWMAKRGGGTLGCTQGWDRKIFDLFGRIDDGVVREDMVIPFRAALLGEVVFLDKQLVLYRRHATNVLLKDINEVKTATQLHLALLKHADSNIATYRTRLQDVDTFQRLFPDRQQSLMSIRKHTLKGLQEMENHKALLLSDNPFKRIGIIGRAIMSGTRFRVIVRWILTFFFPQLYLYYQERLMNKLHPQTRVEEGKIV